MSGRGRGKYMQELLRMHEQSMPNPGTQSLQMEHQNGVSDDDKEAAWNTAASSASSHPEPTTTFGHHSADVAVNSVMPNPEDDAAILENWDPMEEDFYDDTFNSYNKGPGNDLPLNNQRPVKDEPRVERKDYELYVTGIPNAMSEQGIKNLFSRAGDVRRVRKMASQNQNLPGTFGFVRFQQLYEVEQALTMFNDFKIGECMMRVSIAKTKEQRQRAQREREVQRYPGTFRVTDEDEEEEEEEQQRETDDSGPEESSQAPAASDIRTKSAGGAAGLASILEVPLNPSPEGASGAVVSPSGEIAVPSDRDEGNELPNPQPQPPSSQKTTTKDAPKVRKPTKKPEPRPCLLCGIIASKQCGKCQVPYCGAKCQKEDWKHHKLVCRKSANPLENHGIEIDDDYIDDMISEVIGGVNISRLQRETLSITKPTRVIPTDCRSPVDLSLIKACNETKLEELKTSLNTKFIGADTIPDYTPQLGDMCGAPYEGDWYRAVIDELYFVKKEAKVTFVDYGNTETLQITRLAPLPTSLTILPMQAISCTLGIEPVSKSGGWTDRALDLLGHMLAADGDMLATVVSVGKEKSTIDLTKGSISIRAYLISEGVARKTEFDWFRPPRHDGATEDGPSHMSYVTDRSPMVSVPSGRGLTGDNAQIKKYLQKAIYLSGWEETETSSMTKSFIVASPSGQAESATHLRSGDSKTAHAAPATTKQGERTSSELSEHGGYDDREATPPRTPTSPHTQTTSHVPSSPTTPHTKPVASPSGSPSELISSYMQANSLIIGDQIRMKVVNIDRMDKFWVQVLNQTEDVIHIQNQLNAVYIPKTAKNTFRPPKHNLVAVFCRTYEQWFRARVIDWNTSGVHVYYLDYGNHDWIEFTQIHSLDSQFLTLPAQAFCCKVEGVIPRTDVMCGCFMSYVQGVELEAKVMDFEDGVYVLDIWDPYKFDSLKETLLRQASSLQRERASQQERERQRRLPDPKVLPPQVEMPLPAVTSALAQVKMPLPSVTSIITPQVKPPLPAVTSVTPQVKSLLPAVTSTVSPQVKSPVPAVTSTVTLQAKSLLPAVTSTVTPQVKSPLPAVTSTVTPQVKSPVPAVTSTVTPQVEPLLPAVTSALAPHVKMPLPAVTSAVTSVGQDLTPSLGQHTSVIMASSLPMGTLPITSQLHSVFLLNSVSFDNFTIYDRNGSNRLDVFSEKLCSTMKNYTSRYCPKVLGELVYVKSPTLGWFRAEVIKMGQDHMVRVRIVDGFRVLNVSQLDIAPVSEALIQPPVLFIQCALWNVTALAPSINWETDIKPQLLSIKQLKVRVHMPGDPWQVELFSADDELQSLNAQWIRDGLLLPGFPLRGQQSSPQRPTGPRIGLIQNVHLAGQRATPQFPAGPRMGALGPAAQRSLGAVVGDPPLPPQHRPTLNVSSQVSPQSLPQTTTCASLPTTAPDAPEALHRLSTQSKSPQVSPQACSESLHASVQAALHDSPDTREKSTSKVTLRTTPEPSPKPSPEPFSVVAASPAPSSVDDGSTPATSVSADASSLSFMRCSPLISLACGHDKMQKFRTQKPNVTVCHTDNLGSFYCHSNEADVLKSFMEEEAVFREEMLKHRQPDTLPHGKCLKPGDMVAVLTPNDNKWYRARVIDAAFRGTGKVLVRLVDYGQQDLVNTECVRPLTARHMCLPYQAIWCGFPGWDPEKSPDASTALALTKSVLEYNVFNLSLDGHNDGRYQILDIRRPEDNVSLVRNGGILQGVLNMQPLGVLHTQMPCPPAVVMESQLPPTVVKQSPCDPAAVSPPGPVREVSQVLPKHCKGEVIRVDSPSHFYIHIGNPEQQMNLQAIVNQYCRKTSLRGRALTNGQLCCAKFSADAQWYRARVIGSHPDGRQLVIFLDYGNEAAVEKNDLRPIPAGLMVIPPRAVKCTLHGLLEPSDGWRDCDSKMFAGLVSGQRCDVTSHGQNDDFQEVSLTVDNHGDVAKVLRQKNIGVIVPKVLHTEMPCPTNVAMEPLLPSTIVKDLPYTPAIVSPPTPVREVTQVLPKHCKGEVMRVDSPGHFYVHISKPEQQEALQAHLKSYCESTSPGNLTLTVGQLCCAKFSADAQWYRARVIGSHPDGWQLVIFLDYGNEELVETNEIRPIPAELMAIPPKAFKCTLHDLPEPSDGWRDCDSKMFADIVVGQRSGVTSHGQKGDFHEVSLTVDNHGDVAKMLRRKDTGVIIPQVLHTEMPSAPTVVMDPLLPPTVVKDSPYTHAVVSPPNPVREVPQVLPKHCKGEVMRIDSPGQFYVHISKSEEQEALQVRLNSYCQVIPPGGLTLTTGQLCCAKFSADEQWYRGRVIGPEPDGRQLVMFLDYGNEEAVEMPNLRPITAELMATAPKAFKCTLYGLPTPSDGWRDCNTQMFANLVLGQSSDVTSHGQTGDCHVVSLTVGDHGDVAEMLQRKDIEDIAAKVLHTEMPCTPTAVMGPLRPPTIVKDSPYTPAVGNPPNPVREVSQVLPKHCEGEVMRADSPSHFYVQISRPEELEALQARVNSYCQGTSPGGLTLNTGQLCCAKFSVDAQWYRARITGSDSDGRLLVMFLDYGNEDAVNTSDLRPITAELMATPPKAFKCTLHGLPAPSDGWRDCDSQMFADLVLDQPSDVTSHGQTGDCHDVSLMVSYHGDVAKVLREKEIGVISPKEIALVTETLRYKREIDEMKRRIEEMSKLSKSPQS